MTPEHLQTALERALSNTIAARGFDSDRAPATTLRRPKDRSHGDWTSTIALSSAGVFGTDPRALAEELAKILRDEPSVAAAEVSGPGFLNITVAPGSLARIAADIVTVGEAFGPHLDAAAEIDSAIDSRIASNPMWVTARREWTPDAIRFAAASETSAATPPVDFALLRTASSDNPLYLVQSAHAAACRVERRAESAGIGVAEIGAADFDPLALTDDTETALLGVLADFLPTVTRAASAHEPQRITQFLAAVSELFVIWSQTCTVTPTIDEDITSIHASRLVLDRAAITVLATGLRLLGVSAPERM